MNSTNLAKGYILAVAFASAAFVPTISAAPQNIAAFEETESTPANKVLPRIVSQTAAVYPAGQVPDNADAVIVTFTVDEEGKTRDAQVVSTPSPQFAGPAIKAVLAWRFAPGWREGRPAQFKLRAPVTFTVTTAAIDNAPALKRFEPVYPYEMLVAGRGGWGEVSFVVDHAGRAVLTSPTGSSEAAFAKSLNAMIEAAEFTPAKKEKRSVLASSSQRHFYAPESSLDPVAREVLDAVRTSSASIFKVSELDGRPRAVSQRSPVYPRSLRSDGMTGQAEVEFIVDRDGRVLFPRIISATHEDFGWAAATAVTQWKFNPPMRNGHRVETRMSVPVIFDAQQLASAD